MKKFIYILTLVASVCLISCEKEEPMAIVKVSLTNATPFLSDQAFVYGTIECQGAIIGATEIRYGLAIATHPEPTVSDWYWYFTDTIVADTVKWPLKKNYTNWVRNLNEGTTYYVRAMAMTTSTMSVVYGNELSFTTLKTVKTPTFKQTSIITDITYSSANVTYQIASKGQANITEYGIEWSTSVDFGSTHISYNKASSSDQDKLVSQPVTFAMTSLQANTLYYVRAYAENSYGTGYSETWEVKTTAVEKQAVDLGLSVKWANMNVGADSPESYGDYFAWGETKPKTNYSWSTYKYSVGGKDNLTKYCMSRYEGSMDEITTLEPQDDAAYVNWGSNWRTPTQAEWQELISNCTWTWKNRGYVVTAKNGNSIFLPAAGAYDGIYNNYIGGGNYWSSSLYTSDSNCAYIEGFNSDKWKQSSAYYRYVGMTIRAVCQ